MNHTPTFEVQAHPAVEVSLFYQPDRRRYLLILPSFQHELLNIPLEGITVRLRLPQRVRSVRVPPSGHPLRIRREEKSVRFAAPHFQTLLMLDVNHA
jgi:hypothetical protein